MIPGSSTPLMMAAAPAGGYQVSRSLRFNSSDSAYLARTPAVAGNRKTWTWAGWVKRGALGTHQWLFSARSGGSPYLVLGFTDANILRITGDTTTATDLRTSQVFRDAGAWFHLVVAVDTTQATASNRIKIYVNGAQITTFSQADYPGLNNDTNVNATVIHHVSGQNTYGEYFNGCLAEVFFIDGQQLTPSSFTEVSATTGQLIPLAYSGTFGTNGFWLKFSDNSAATAAALGNDYSGNNNDWTPNNLSVTAGAGNDSLVDTPTSFGTDTSVGGEVRGNYATLNPLLPTLTPTNGNLDTPNSSGQNYSTIAVSTGKWYVESTVGPITAGTACGLGLHFNPTAETGAGFYTSGAYIALLYENNLARYEGANSAVNFYPTAGAGSILAIKIDLDSGTQTISYYVNNVLITSSNLPAGKTWFVTTRQNNNQSLNFGQRPFAYTAPSGFKALCDTNLGAPLVAKPNTLMDVSLWTGNGTQTIVSGLQYSPDFVWIKSRSTTAYHMLFDVVRGAQARLHSNTTDQEQTGNNDLTSFNSDGYTLDNNSSPANTDVNGSGITYVGWSWDAGTSTVSNTQGSITSQVRANVSAGFSVVGWTSNGTFGIETTGHGLGVSPDLIIVKNRDASSPWQVFHSSFSNTASDYLFLNTTDAKVTSGATIWTRSSTTFGYRQSSIFTNGQKGIAYCFAAVVGYSSFGSYTGNGSADGPFVYTGFRPRWLLVKRTDSAIEWKILDTARSSTGNVVDDILYPDLSNAEGSNDSNHAYDFLSNGFKLRTTHSSSNASGGTYIFAAFAENPFQYARAR